MKLEKVGIESREKKKTWVERENNILEPSNFNTPKVNSLIYKLDVYSSTINQ